jgi:K+-sensing histidine kinase KdpD
MEYTKTLTRIAELSAQTGTEQTSIERIVSEAASLVTAGMASAFRIGQQGNLRHLAGLGIPPHAARRLEEAGTSGWTTNLLGESISPVVVQDASTNPAFEEIGTWARLLDISTMAFVPLHHESKTMGMLVLYHRAPYNYSPNDCDALLIAGALISVPVARMPMVEGELPASAKSQLFSVLSHELRTPLTSIMGFAQLIRKRLNSSGTSDPRLLEQLDVLWAQAQRLNRLIDTFVDMSRIERGEFEITQGQVELTGLLRSACQQALAQAGSHHTLNMDIPSRPLWLHGDSKRLEQALSHVISNAIRYSPHDQPIKVSCKLNGMEKAATIEIVDQGPGIPATRLKEIFDRDHPSGPLKSGGLGIGLYLSKVIVEAHGGRISIESASGMGTKVTIVLPV